MLLSGDFCAIASGLSAPLCEVYPDESRDEAALLTGGEILNQFQDDGCMRMSRLHRALAPFVVEHGVDFKVNVLVVHEASVTYNSFVFEAESFRNGP